MIKANELRIGNWIEIEYHDGKQYEQITWIDDAYAEDFNPIPLTPEILEKVGFNKRRYGVSSSDQTYKLLIPDRTPDAYPHIEIIADEAWLIIHDYSFAEAPCKYLHQLQNLYFALTGTELEINI